MTILSWDKPKQVLTKEEWQDISADSAPPGVYTPNMSEDDRLKWRAKLIKGHDPRVEIRKGYGFGASQKIVVRFHQGIEMTANNAIWMTWKDYADFCDAVTEARLALAATE